MPFPVCQTVMAALAITSSSHNRSERRFARIEDETQKAAGAGRRTGRSWFRFDHERAAAGTLNSSFDVLRQIRDDIVSGVFEPNDRLKFEDLRDRYRASIGTLREALLHLFSEGFVRSESNRGFTVAPVSAADLMDITELRVQFEKQALEDSIQSWR